jgi:hypothetical protein
MALGAMGVSLMLAGSNWRQAAVAPGPLTSHHAQVLRAADWQSRCSACHAVGEQSSTEWVAAAAIGHRQGLSQSALCMRCHEQSISANFALAAHTVDPAMLAELIGDRHTTLSTGEHACSTCHQEHHGADFDLTQMSDARCQACHSQQYDHFATDHPEFTGWPYQRRSRLAFDHAGHAAKHFATHKTTFDCRMCHVSDATGDEQLTLGFEQACGNCHSERLQLAAQVGFELLRLPIIDDQALAEAGQVVDWPLSASGDFDGRLSAATKLLLAGNAATVTAMNRFGPSADLFDADPSNPADMAAVATIAQAIKQLALGLANEPAAVVARRLRESGANANMAEVAASTIGPTAGSAAVWFGGHSAESSEPRWTRDDQINRIIYRPIGHADPLLKAWLDMVATIEQPALRDQMLSELGGAGSPGTCLVCHTADQKRGGQIAINWCYEPDNSGERNFTHFSHKPHTLQPELSDCTHCHAVRGRSAPVVHLLAFNPQVFVSDFEPVSKAACAACHTNRGAASRCTTCHHYHLTMPAYEPPVKPPGSTQN